MPSTTTYLQVVNKVLRAAHVAPVLAADFASPAGTPNAREIRQAKEIVAEVYLGIQNDRPDSFFQKSKETRLYKPFVEGGVVKITAAAPTTIDFAFDGALDFDDVPWFAGGSYPHTPLATFLHIQGERQYYRVSVVQSATRLLLESANIEHVGYDDATHPIGYTLFKRAYDLPADFSDILNVYNEYVGSDLRPMGNERVVEEMISAGVLPSTAGGAFGTDPELYAIWRHPQTSVPILLVHPVPAEDRVLTVRYKKLRTAVVNATDVFDMDEDQMPWFWDRCKALGALEIAGDAQSAGMYEQWAKRGQDGAVQKSLESGGENMRLRPNTGEDYRSHYSSRGIRDSRRNIFLSR